MNTITAILSMVLLVLNLPIASALHWGMKLHTDSTCPEDIKDVKRSKLALKIITSASAAIAFVLIIISAI